MGGPDSTPPDAAGFVALAMANPLNAEILRRLPQLGLPQCHLVAGCLFQAIWNARCDRPPETGVKDYDVFYFDEADISYAAEDAVIQRAAALFADLGVTVEVKNQARVHLWYGQRFGGAYPRLRSVQDGIDRYLIPCTCVGIEAGSGELYAPYGLAELWRGILRMNPVHPDPLRFREKAESFSRPLAVAHHCRTGVVDPLTGALIAASAGPPAGSSGRPASAR